MKKLYCKILNKFNLRIQIPIILLLNVINPMIRYKAYIFGCPTHLNMGDQAQTYCIREWIKKNYPNYKIIIFPHLVGFLNNIPFRILKYLIRSNDMMFGHSGYFMVDHHLGYKDYCRIIKQFPNKKFIIFPQTINFHDNKLKQLVSKIFNSNGNVTLMCRDKISYQKAQELFNRCKLLLYPDVVTSLIGTKKYNNYRNGILFVKRNDTEAFFTINQINELRRKLEKENIMSDITDTSINVPYRKINGNREKYLFEMVERFSNYELIVTDRYHGTIFSLIANTPVLVISSTDHKLSSGVNWFPTEFSDYIGYVDNLEDAYKKIKEMLDSSYLYSLTNYFDVQYFSLLKNKI